LEVDDAGFPLGAAEGLSRIAFLSWSREVGVAMVKKEIMDKVRAALRERRNSHFSEVYFRVTEHKISSI
jgi:hypothetical protein